MLKKKRLFALLMAGSLLPMIATAADDKQEPPKDDKKQEQKKGEAKGDEKKADDKAGENKKADDKKDGAGFFEKINQGVDGACGYANAPLTNVVNRLVKYGAKSKFMVTAFLAYLGFRVYDRVIEDVKNAPDTIKRCLNGGDCDADCRSPKDWDTDE